MFIIYSCNVLYGKLIRVVRKLLILIIEIFEEWFRWGRQMILVRGGSLVRIENMELYFNIQRFFFQSCIWSLYKYKFEVNFQVNYKVCINIILFNKLMVVKFLFSVEIKSNSFISFVVFLDVIRINIFFGVLFFRELICFFLQLGSGI